MGAETNETLAQRAASLRSVADYYHGSEPGAARAIFEALGMFEILAAANAQLERERDDMKSSVDGLLDAIGYVHQVINDDRVLYPEAQDDPFDFARRLIGERDAATAALAKAEAALKPFAEADDLEDAQDRWNIWEHPAAMNITIGHLRAARAALIQAPEPNDDE